VGSRNEQENGDDGAHLETKPYGACVPGEANPSPRLDRHGEDNLATQFNNWNDAMAF